MDAYGRDGYHVQKSESITHAKILSHPRLTLRTVLLGFHLLLHDESVGSEDDILAAILPANVCIKHEKSVSCSYYHRCSMGSITVYHGTDSVHSLERSLGSQSRDQVHSKYGLVMVLQRRVQYRHRRCHLDSTPTNSLEAPTTTVSQVSSSVHFHVGILVSHRLGDLPFIPYTNKVSLALSVCLSCACNF